MKHLFSCLIWLLLSAPLTSLAMDVAFTVDNLPSDAIASNGNNGLDVMGKFLDTLAKHQIDSVYGMVNGSKLDNNPQDLVLLYAWLTAGHKLGNHTYSHLDLAQNTAEDFILDITKNINFLKMFNSQEKFNVFRYPYLSYGETEEKYKKVKIFLQENNHKIAYVTLDFFDYLWEPAYKRCLAQNNQDKIQWLKKTFLEQAEKALEVSHALSMMLFDRDIQYIQLYHLYSFHALMLDELLTLYKKLDVNFVHLEEALKDAVYDIEPQIYRTRSHNFLHNIRIQRGLDNPLRVQKYYDEFPEKELLSVCTVPASVLAPDADSNPDPIEEKQSH